MRISRAAAPVLFVWLIPATVVAQDAPPPSESTPAGVANPNPCSRYGLSTVFRCIGHDLRRVADDDALRVLAAGGLLAAGSILLDDEVVTWLADADQDPAVGVAEDLGEAGVHYGGAFAAYLVARATGHEGAANLAIALFRMQVVNGILTRGLKLLPRPRPYQEVATLTKGSFPSGHTSAAFATATVMQRKWGWRAGVPAYGVAAFVGATRLQNTHYLSDVVFGAALGVASGLALRLPGPAPTVAPILAPGAVGVSFTLSRWGVDE